MRLRFALAAAAASFAAAAGVLTLSGGEGSRPAPAADPDALAARAAGFLQRVRETGDGGLYERAETVLRRALRVDPDNAAALMTRGSLRLSRHQFRAALADGQAALRSAPETVTPLGVVVDAQVELGRYRAAARTLQRMIDLRPDLSSYSRVSYLRELHGDLPGALEAIRRAASAGTGENAASALVTLGHLHFVRGDYRAAARASRDALQRQPGYPAALSGLADASAAEGRLARAIALWRRALDLRPSADYAQSIGEAELARGRPDRARRALARARGLMGGVAIDHERALFEADHGDPHRAVVRARAVYAAAPSAESAGILGWALTRAGSPHAGLRWVPRALRLGTRDPEVLYRTGMIARAAGRTGLARRLLGRALQASPRFSPLLAPRAVQALEEL